MHTQQAPEHAKKFRAAARRKHFPRMVACGSLLACLAVGLAAATGGAGFHPQAADEEKAPLDYGTELTQGEAVLQDDSGTLNLQVMEDGTAIVTDAQTGRVWRSNPEAEALQNDPYSMDDNKYRLASQLLVTYKNATNTTEDTSFVRCQQEDPSCSITRYTREDCITVVYRFENLGFTIPLQYRMDDRRMQVSVPVEGIVEDRPEAPLLALSILPFFGAADMEDQGYMLLPDGSGSIIRFNNGKTNEGQLTVQTLYGDRSVTYDKRQAEVLPVLLPCFGIHQEASEQTGGAASVLGYATVGSYAGTITTNIAGRESGYNYMYYTFQHRQNQMETMLDRTYMATTRLLVDSQPVGFDRYEMTYCFPGPEESGLKGLAQSCRDLLFSDEESDHTVAAPDLFIDTYMGVRVTRNFLGIPYEDLDPLTTFAQAGDMAKALQAGGVEQIQMRLLGLDSDGAAQYPIGKLDNGFRPDRALGGTKGYSALQEIQGLAVYADLELTTFSKNGNGISRAFSAANDLTKENVRYRDFTIGSGIEVPNGATNYLLRISKLPEVMQSLIADLNQAQVQNVCAASLGYAPYADYSKGQEVRPAQSMQILAEAAGALQERGGLMLQAPSANLMPYADQLIDIPTTSAGHNLADGSVPFLQMVLSGRVAYTGESVNMSGNRDEVLLRSIETGSALRFSLMEASYEQVGSTPLSGLYACTFDEQKEDVLTLFGRHKEALAEVYGLQIVDYDVSLIGSSLRAVTYENGKTVVVNYGDQAAQWKGHSVPARGSLTVEGEVTHG